MIGQCLRYVSIRNWLVLAPGPSVQPKHARPHNGRMATEPPPTYEQLSASDLPGCGVPYLLRPVDEDNWHLVKQRPIHRLVPLPGEGFLPQEVTVTLADGTERMFNPQDQVLVGPAAQGGGSGG